MSKMSTVMQQIDSMLAEGKEPLQIATMLNVPLEWVLDAQDELNFGDDYY